MFHPLIIAMLLTVASCGLLEETQELIELEEYNDLTCDQEKSQLYLEDLFVEYPTLKPSDRAKVIELKRSFVKMLDMETEEQMELIAGASTPYQVLAYFLARFRKLATEEYEILSATEQAFCESLDEYVRHKLFVKPQAKYLHQKKIALHESGQSRDQFSKNLNSNCGTISHQWDMDPSYEAAEKAFKDPAFEEALRAFTEKNDNDEMLSIHIDHQTQKKKIETVKINREL